MGVNIYTKEGWLDWNKIVKLAKNCPWITAVGMRQVGKTYGVIKWCIEHNKTFLFVRRTKTQYDMIFKPETNPFKPLVDDGILGPITFKTVNKDITAVYRAIEDDDGKIVPNGEKLGLCTSLSCFANTRGAAFPEIDVIIMDEFIKQKNEAKIKGEAGALLNLYYSVNSNRELRGKQPVRMFCLANANDISNPLYVELNIVTKAYEMMQNHQEISIDEKHKLCMIHLYRSPIAEKMKHVSTLAALTSLNPDSEFNQMAFYNQFAVQETDSLKSFKLPGEWNPVCTIGGITIYSHKRNRTYYVSTHKTGTCRTYATTQIEKRRFINRFLYLYTAFLRSQVYFQDYTCLVMFQKAFDPSEE